MDAHYTWTEDQRAKLKPGVSVDLVRGPKDRTKVAVLSKPVANAAWRGGYRVDVLHPTDEWVGVSIATLDPETIDDCTITEIERLRAENTELKERLKAASYGMKL